MQLIGKQVCVAKALPPDFFEGLSEPPLIIEPGDVLTIMDALSKEWPEFVLVLNGKGERGWVPARYLKHQEKGALAIKRYDTTTLNPLEGEMLEIVEEDLTSGWLWCRDRNGRLGWFAMDHLSDF